MFPIYCVIRVCCKYVNKLVNINNSYQSVPVTGRIPVTYYGGSGGITKGQRNKMPKKKRQEPVEEIIVNEVTPEPKSSTLVRPVPFYGKLDEDVDSWIKDFDRIARANFWSDGRKCVTIPAFLRDQAADYYESLDDDLKDDYRSVCDSLRERFIPKELQSLYYSNLFGYRQAEIQTVDDYAANITKLATRAYMDMPRRQKETLTKEHFIQGLRPEIKRFVLLSNPKTFEEAFRHAKREECNNSLVDNSRTRVAAMSHEPKRTEELEKSIADLSAQVSVMATEIGRISSQRQYTSNTRGQNVRGSWRGRGRGLQPRSDRNLRTTDGRPICNNCQRVGHIAVRCKEQRTTNSGN